MPLPRPVRLADMPKAPNPRRLRIFMAEKSIEIPSEFVDIMAGAHRSAEYVAWAGRPVVPAVELADGTTLTESVAIMRYLEALHPEPNLFGADPLETARIEMWHRRMEFGLMQQAAAIVRHLNPRMAALEEKQVPEWGEVNRPRLQSSLRALDRQLADHPYVGGDRYSVADITPHVAIDFLRVMRLEVPDELGCLRRWLSEVRSRPSAAA